MIRYTLRFKEGSRTEQVLQGLSALERREREQRFVSEEQLMDMSGSCLLDRIILLGVLQSYTEQEGKKIFKSYHV